MGCSRVCFEAGSGLGWLEAFGRLYLHPNPDIVLLVVLIVVVNIVFTHRHSRVFFFVFFSVRLFLSLLLGGTIHLCDDGLGARLRESSVTYASPSVPGRHIGNTRYVFFVFARPAVEVSLVVFLPCLLTLVVGLRFSHGCRAVFAKFRVHNSHVYDALVTVPRRYHFLGRSSPFSSSKWQRRLQVPLTFALHRSRCRTLSGFPRWWRHSGART